jgi:hypothetical protein
VGADSRTEMRACIARARGALDRVRWARVQGAKRGASRLGCVVPGKRRGAGAVWGRSQKDRNRSFQSKKERKVSYKRRGKDGGKIKL